MEKLRKIEDALHKCLVELDKVKFAKMKINSYTVIIEKMNDIDKEKYKDILVEYNTLLETAKMNYRAAKIELDYTDFDR